MRRSEAYRIAGIVAWPALVWCTTESALRMTVGDPSGAMSSSLLAFCAGGMILAAGLRRRQLREAATTPPR